MVWSSTIVIDPSYVLAIASRQDGHVAATISTFCNCGRSCDAGPGRDKRPLVAVAHVCFADQRTRHEKRRAHALVASGARGTRVRRGQCIGPALSHEAR